MSSALQMLKYNTKQIMQYISQRLTKIQIEGFQGIDLIMTIYVIYWEWFVLTKVILYTNEITWIHGHLKES